MANYTGDVVSGLFGIVGKGMDYAFNSNLTWQQNAFNREMWDLNNTYNSPANQMKRFEEAGLNPSLLYGQISSGNAPHAPVKSAPQAPEVSEDMRLLGQAFNIEGLRTTIAQRKKAEEEARIAKAQADDAESQNRFFKDLGWDYKLVNGQLVKKSEGDEWTVSDTPGLIAQGRLLQALENNYRTNSLLAPRASLIGSQTLLNQYRRQYLAPQIQMTRYAAKYFPASFWIGNAKQGVQTLGSFLPLFY